MSKTSGTDSKLCVTSYFINVIIVLKFIFLSSCVQILKQRNENPKNLIDPILMYVQEVFLYMECTIINWAWNIV